MLVVCDSTLGNVLLAPEMHVFGPAAKLYPQGIDCGAFRPLESVHLHLDTSIALSLL